MIYLWILNCSRLNFTFDTCGFLTETERPKPSFPESESESADSESLEADIHEAPEGQRHGKRQIIHHMDVSENSGGYPPKSSILIGFSIIFTIHFRVPLFLETPILNIYFTNPVWHCCNLSTTRNVQFLGKFWVFSRNSKSRSKLRLSQFDSHLNPWPTFFYNNPGQFHIPSTPGLHKRISMSKFTYITYWSI